LWGLPWGLGVHGDHRALKKKRQGDLLGSARHGLTKAINPSPRGPRDPRTWEGEIPDEKGIRDCSGSRQGRVEPCAGVNCSAPALPRRPRGGPGARRRRGIGEEEEDAAARIEEGEEETKKRKKKLILRRREAARARCTWRAARRCRARPAALLPLPPAWIPFQLTREE